MSQQPDLIAHSEVIINSSIEKVWNALINPAIIKQYMFGATVISDWTKGSGIAWRGEWQGKHYEDKGNIVQIIPHQKLQYTHFSPLSGLEDKAENYHTVTIELSKLNQQIKITLSQDHNPNEEAKQHSEANWTMVLSGLKKILESKSD